MRKAILRFGLGALAATLAIGVAAQGPPDGGPGGLGPPPGPMWGMFEIGGVVGGFGGKTVTGKPFQATFTTTRVETLPGNTITNTTTGTVARSADGSTYRDAKFPAIGPWAASGKVQEFIYIRNVTKGTQYVVNVTKGTYRAFPIGDRPPAPGAKGLPNDSAASNEIVNDSTNATYTDPVTNTVYGNVDDRKVTRTIPAGQIGNQNPIVITTERWYSNDLDVLFAETRSDPRFGTSTYRLSNLGNAPSSSLFVPDPSFTEENGKFGPGGHHGGGKLAPPPPGN